MHVLGRALLWKVWEAAHGDLGARNCLEAGTNPVWRANIGITGINAELYVFKIMGSGGEDEGGASGPGAVGRGPRTMSREHQVELRFLASEVQRLQRAVADNAEQVARRDVIMRYLLVKINRNLARLASAPGRRMAVEPSAVSDAAVAA